MDKTNLSERDICTKFITPALRKAGWDEQLQIREEVSFTKGRIIVRGKLVTRGQAKRADYVLYYKPNIPIALIEAKDHTHAIGDGMQQGLDYAETLNIPKKTRYRLSPASVSTSTVNRSQAAKPSQCACRNVFQGVRRLRSGAGSIPWSRKIRFTVVRAIVCPRFESASRIRV